ncbi:MAG: gluconeogenesis factor YvcK family protein [Chloroflexota bacterium]
MGKVQGLKRWLSVGLGIKRWLFLLVVGVVVLAMGIYSLLSMLVETDLFPSNFYHYLTLSFIPLGIRLFILFVLGGGLVIWAILQIGTRLISPFDLPEGGITTLLNDAIEEKGPSIVVIGGGTGLPSVLRGLRPYIRPYNCQITAIVTVADDGGSSGRLRREFGLLPPGDFRNNMAALSRDEALMTKVLQYRFGGNVTLNGHNELRGHAFGNLLLAALSGITGSFDESLLAAEKVLSMQGHVLPSTMQDVSLGAEVLMPSGETAKVIGESKIPEANGRIQRVFLQPETARAYPPALKAIFQADLIIMGPGSLYTSILPNLLIPDLSEALRRAQALKLYICNLATQPGETDNYTVADHVTTIFNHIPNDCVNIVLANNNLSIPPEQGGGKTVYVAPDHPKDVELVLTDLVDEKRPWRHDSEKLAKAIWKILDRR